MPRSYCALVLSLLMLALSFPLPVEAQVCEPASPQINLQYLRRLRIDLTGKLPTVEEAMQVVKHGEVPESLIDKMLNSDDFVSEMRRMHKDLLWANLSVLPFGRTWQLNSGNGSSSPLYSRDRGERYRGVRSAGCLNEPALIKDGVIQTKCKEVEDRGVKRRLCQEGWVMVKPYWSPDTRVKVCAFDAQKLHILKLQNGKTYDCSRGNGNKACGCGPELRWCQSVHHKTRETITQSLLQQYLNFTTHTIKSNRPYTAILTAREMKLNGPITFFLKHQTYTLDNGMYRADPGLQLPNLSFLQKDQWVPIQRNSLHAGLMTLPVYLIKFASNRSRANRFFNAFLCKEFQSPPGGLPPGQDTCHNEPNLMKRCGCKYCHQTLEPAASYWGRWKENGAVMLSIKQYPAFRPNCAKHENRNNSLCRSNYLTRNIYGHERYRGYLKAYLFATPQMKVNIESGPIGLARSAISDGSFASCTVKNIWKWFVGRSSINQSRIEDYGKMFQSQKYNLKALMKVIVTSDAYKRGRLSKQSLQGTSK